MNENTRELRAALKRAIITTSTEIAAARATARVCFAEGRRRHQANDEAGAAAARTTAWQARETAEGLAPVARRLFLAYGFLRGVPYATIEGSRKRASVPTAEDIVAELGDRADTPHLKDAVRRRPEAEAWLAGAPRRSSRPRATRSTATCQAVR